MTDEYRDPLGTEQDAPRDPLPPRDPRAEDPQTQQPQEPQAPQQPQQPHSAFYNGSAPQTGWGYQPPRPEPPRPPKKKNTGLVIGIVAAAVAYLILLGLLLVSLRGRTPASNTPAGNEQTETAVTEEQKGENPPIVTDPKKEGTGAVVNPDYTGDTLTPVELYKNNVESVVYVEASYANGKSMGSGFVIDDENGYILTNQHVVSKANDISITLVSGDSYTAELVGSDEINDIAVLKVKAPGLKKVTIGDSSVIEVGSFVNVIGNPLGELTFTMTRGIISAVDRSINTGEYNITTFQIDAAVNSGNSGGPAFDDRGAVIGVVSAKYAASGVEGLGFCIPINDAMKIAADLVDYGYVKGRPNFGITVSTSSGYTTKVDEFGRRSIVETVQGAVVEQVGKDSCAAKAGLKVGDIITKLGDVKVTTASGLLNAKNAYKAGDTVTLEVFRDEQLITLTVVLDEYTPD